MLLDRGYKCFHENAYEVYHRKQRVQVIFNVVIKLLHLKSYEITFEKTRRKQAVLLGCFVTGTVQQCNVLWLCGSRDKSLYTCDLVVLKRPPKYTK